MTNFDTLLAASGETLLGTLRQEIRAGLKEKLMAAAEVEVDAAVDAACARLEVQLQSAADYLNLRSLVQVVVQRRPA